MHSYATDSDEKQKISFILVTISILSAWSLHRIPNLTMPWWFDAPSVIGFYGIFYNIFDKYLWKIDVFKKIRLVKIPCLQGTWEGYITSSFDSHKIKHDGTIKINQTYSRISIILESKESKSHSITASILTKNQDMLLISYEYLNEPTPNSKKSMHIHRGTARLQLSSDNQELNGEYYSGRDRKNIGSLKFNLTISKN